MLSGANTYNGTTTVSAGVLNIQNATALGTTAGGTTVASGAALELQGGITVGAEALTISGTGVSTGGALRNISGTNTYGGLLTLGAASQINSDAGTLTLSNTGTITGGGFGLTVGGAGNTTIASIIGTTTGTLTKDGAGILALSGANTYSGNTTVNSGKLDLQSLSAVASANTIQLSGGTLLLSQAGTYNINTINVTASSTIDFGNAGVTNLALQNLSIASNATLTIANWVKYSDSFTSQNAPTINSTAVSGGTNIANITFNNYGEQAQWNSGSFSAKQIGAVPEPSTYGAMLMAGCAGLFGFRRWRAKRRIGPVAGSVAG